MADKEAAGQQAKPAVPPAAEAPKGNPVFRMMGLPNFRFKLPSRNWMIFWTIVGSWTGAVVYDRQQKKRTQRKWCKVVSDLAKEPLPSTALQRKLTIYLSAPPGDGLIPAREHFQEYVKPILVAAALDWDAVEGRREGDVRAGLAEKIRKLRKLSGEATTEPLEGDDLDIFIEAIREKAGVQKPSGVEGDIVIGRHAWKEYVRGLHEGWLGPLDAPPAPSSPPTEPIEPVQAPNSDESSPVVAEDSNPEEKKADETPKESEESEEEKKPKKKKQPPPFNKTSEYAESMTAPSLPNELPPSIPVHLPHLLGFLNTPIRMYRFLNRRAVAEDAGKQAASAVFALYRPYESPSQTQLSIGMSGSLDPDNQPSGVEAGRWEQEFLLQKEEPEWHKSVRKEAAEGGELNKDGKERIWTANMVLDERIAQRMRKFELDRELEERVKEVDRSLKPWYYFGYGDKKPDEESGPKYDRRGMA